MIEYQSTISNPTNLRVFARCIQCLSKVGTELIIEITRSQILLRTLSSSQAAFAAFTFLHGSFFSQFHFSINSGTSQRLERTGKVLPEQFVFQVDLKTCLAAVSKLGSISTSSSSNSNSAKSSQGISLMKMSIDESKNSWVWEIRMLSGIVKRIWIGFDDETNKLGVPQVDVNDGYEFFSVRPKLLLSCLTSGFHHGIEEVTIGIEKDSLKLSSYIDGFSLSHKKYLSTTYKMHKRDFEHFSGNSFWIPNEDSSPEPAALELTFCLKEFKAFLTLCEQTDSLFHLFCRNSGEPIVLKNYHEEEKASHAGQSGFIILSTLRDHDKEGNDDDNPNEEDEVYNKSSALKSEFESDQEMDDASSNKSKASGSSPKRRKISNSSS